MTVNPVRIAHRSGWIEVRSRTIRNNIVMITVLGRIQLNLSKRMFCHLLSCLDTLFEKFIRIYRSRRFYLICARVFSLVNWIRHSDLRWSVRYTLKCVSGYDSRFIEK